MPCVTTDQKVLGPEKPNNIPTYMEGLIFMVI